MPKLLKHCYKLIHSFYSISSVQFSHSVVSDSLQPHGLQHARLPCPSPTPGACLNSCLSSRWCHPTIPSSVVPFLSCLQSFPASGPFPMSQFFASGSQSFSFNISPSNEYSGLITFRMDWLDLLAVQGTLKSLLQHHSSKASILRHSAFFIVQTCWGPAWGTPPMAKVMRKEARHTQRRDRVSGVPLEILEHLPP